MRKPFYIVCYVKNIVCSFLISWLCTIDWLEFSLSLSSECCVSDFQLLCLCILSIPYITCIVPERGAKNTRDLAIVVGDSSVGRFLMIMWLYTGEAFPVLTFERWIKTVGSICHSNSPISRAWGVIILILFTVIELV